MSELVIGQSCKRLTCTKPWYSHLVGAPIIPMMRQARVACWTCFFGKAFIIVLDSFHWRITKGKIGIIDEEECGVRVVS